MARQDPYSAETRERAVRMVLQHMAEHNSPWAAIRYVSTKIGCTSEDLRTWIRTAESDAERRGARLDEERQRLEELERENRDLRRANRILQEASAQLARRQRGRRDE